MNQAAAHLSGEHDFSAFRAANARPNRPSRICALATSSDAAIIFYLIFAPTASCTTWCAISSAAWSRSARANSRRSGCAKSWPAATARLPRPPSRRPGCISRHIRYRCAVWLAGNLRADGCIAYKICGITRVQDLHAACDAGADALGLVFYDKARASVDREQPPRCCAHCRLSSIGRACSSTPSPRQSNRCCGRCRWTCCSSTATRRRNFARASAGPISRRCGSNREWICYNARLTSMPRAGLAAGCLCRGHAGRHRRDLRLGLIPPDLPLPVILSGGLTPDNVADGDRAGAALGGGCVPAASRRPKESRMRRRLPRSCEGRTA